MTLPFLIIIWFFTAELHRVRGDASHAALIHGYKAHVAEVASLFYFTQMIVHKFSENSPEKELEEFFKATVNSPDYVDDMPSPKIDVVWMDTAKLDTHNDGILERATVSSYSQQEL